MTSWLKADIAVGTAQHRLHARYDRDAAPPAAVEWPEPVAFNEVVNVNGADLYAIDCRAQAGLYEVTLAAAPLLPTGIEDEPEINSAAVAPQPEAAPMEDPEHVSDD